MLKNKQRLNAGHMLGTISKGKSQNMRREGVGDESNHFPVVKKCFAIFLLCPNAGSQ